MGKLECFFLFNAGYNHVQWNLTFIQIDLVHSLPPCYYEFMTVEHAKAGHYYSDHTGIFGFFRAKMFDHQMCGFHSKIHFYPKDLDIDIIYVNKAVESDSDFSVLFQIMDNRLMISHKTNFRFQRYEVINLQQRLSIGKMLTIEIFYLKVKKLSIVSLHIHSNSPHYIYDGPVIGKHFKVKPFRSNIKLSSFQCTILFEINSMHDLKYSAIDRDVSSSLFLREGDIISVQLPVPKCQHRYGQHCMFKVSSP